jgi:NAD(P)-dependent dehydrogenase (short-subunit alcohol dehydrogenase family)
MTSNEARAAIVTGAGSGIGAATARLLAARGWRLHLVDITTDAELIAEELREAGHDVRSSQVDVSRQPGVALVVAAAVDAFGRVDGLVNSAGIDGTATRFTDIDEADVDRLLAVNLKGVLFTMQAVLPAMLAQGGGAIVNIASASALVGIPRLAAYSATKGAVVALSRSAAVELAGKGIRVNAICPGAIHTRMLEQSVNFDPVELARSGAGAPMRRVGAAAEIADAVFYLLSDASTYVTGTALVVDGGLTAR